MRRSFYVKQKQLCDLHLQPKDERKTVVAFVLYSMAALPGEKSVLTHKFNCICDSPILEIKVSDTGEKTVTLKFCHDI